MPKSFMEITQGEFMKMSSADQAAWEAEWLRRVSAGNNLDVQYDYDIAKNDGWGNQTTQRQSTGGI